MIDLSNGLPKVLKCRNVPLLNASSKSFTCLGTNNFVSAKKIQK